MSAARPVLLQKRAIGGPDLDPIKRPLNNITGAWEANWVWVSGSEEIIMNGTNRVTSRVRRDVHQPTGAGGDGRVPQVRHQRTWAENGFFECF